jgi:hypothetical protein
MAAANNGLSTTITPPCSAAFFLKKNSEPHTGARPSVRLCVGPELARCVHFIFIVIDLVELQPLRKFGSEADFVPPL